MPVGSRMVGLLGSGDIVVWWIATEGTSAAECQRMFSLLDREERERAGRFHFEADRRDFIVAHGLLRSMLTRHLEPNLPPTAWRFANDQHGKPEIVGPLGQTGFAFNLSHTRGMVAAGVASGRKIGIDVERVDAAKADLKIAEMFFAPSEVGILRQAPEEDRIPCFFRIWTLKEAYLKATGTGLGTPLDSFAFTLDPIALSFHPQTDEAPERWHFEILPATDQHVLSIAVSREPGTIRVVSRALTTQDLETMIGFS